ncbi:catalase [Helicobacter didelphidarum]|uniref:Catalase-related peroxidase n=2 Tax=Helicobacter didelphidarum TaxID=2040648 RepID=A0A3D8IS30_9HELI|nr:catalase [Helicobacter didelphidarum]
MVLVSSFLASIQIAYAESHDKVFEDSNTITNQFYEIGGDKNNPYKKVNHTKGFCALGEFIPNKNFTKTYVIPLMKEAKIPTQVRFSLGGANPNESDKSKTRAMALKMNGKNDSWEIVMTNSEINFAKNPEEFMQFLQFKIDIKNSKITQEQANKAMNKVDSFNNFNTHITSLPNTSSFSQASYHSVHTFYFNDIKSNKQIPARWKFVPINRQPITQKEFEKLGNNFLESHFQDEVKKSPIEFKFLLVLANPNDPTDNINAIWNGKHKEVEVGILKITQYDGQECNGDVFMPNILPNGVNEPKDPMFAVRNAVYSATFNKRQ